VKRRPHWRKENQCVMNRQQSTSISGKHHPENHKGEGSTPNASLRLIKIAAAIVEAHARRFAVVSRASAARPGTQGPRDDSHSPAFTPPAA